MNAAKIRSIAVEGVIGVGKTSLARAIAQQLGAHGYWEDDLPNPFLERFYAQRQRWGLACQLRFLVERLRQFRQSPPDHLPVVADHTIDKELLFAQVNCEPDEYDLYRDIFTQLAVQCAFQPQVVIYLSADAQTLISRIRERGRDMEGAIDLSYLQALHHHYHGWFTGRGGENHRVVVVDADGHFIARDQPAVARLIEAAIAAPPGVSYCNPIG
ncbi:MAG: deoxynucleoside kinase [Planctomycetota bacterium]|nr:MAG: deoxynucleoside kinase [Planctomycetota bacterium]